MDTAGGRLARLEPIALDFFSQSAETKDLIHMSIEGDTAMPACLRDQLLRIGGPSHLLSSFRWRRPFRKS